jgi:hypothetical protein
MAIYPDDATAPITAFSVVGESTFNNTGASRTEFNLPSAVDHKGEITLSSTSSSIIKCGLTYNTKCSDRSGCIIRVYCH